MTFDEWWAQQTNIYIDEKEQSKLAWDAATAAERERCAKIADETMLPLGARSNSAALPYDAGNREACFHIASRIRKG